MAEKTQRQVDVFRSPSSYKLIMPVDSDVSSAKAKIHGVAGLMRLHPKRDIPEGYVVVTELFNRSVFDEDGRLNPKYTAKKRYIKNDN